MHSRLTRLAAGAVVALSLFGAAGVAQASSLTSTQVNAIINLMHAFGADQSVIDNVQASLTGQPATINPTSPQGSNTAEPCLDLPYNLGVGSVNHSTSVTDVSNLQQFLAVSPTGHFGPLTKQAVARWQSAHGISAIGYVGPQTRKVIGCNASAVPATSVSNTTVFNGMGFQLTLPSGWNAKQLTTDKQTMMTSSSLAEIPVKQFYSFGSPQSLGLMVYVGTSGASSWVTTQEKAAMAIYNSDPSKNVLVKQTLNDGTVAERFTLNSANGSNIEMFATNSTYTYWLTFYDGTTDFTVVNKILDSLIVNQSLGQNAASPAPVPVNTTQSTSIVSQTVKDAVLAAADNERQVISSKNVPAIRAIFVQRVSDSSQASQITSATDAEILNEATLFQSIYPTDQILISGQWSMQGNQVTIKSGSDSYDFMNVNGQWY